MASVFRGVIEFFDQIGVYDVVLPFLLVFTIVFAIFEKTKVLGTDEIEGKRYTKKNLNAMIAFVIAFLVVASSKLVEIVLQVSAQMVVLLLASVFFLLLIGSFYSEGEEVYLKDKWRIFFMVIMFIGIVAIFLQAIKTESGEPFLEWFIKYILNNFNSTAVASIVLIVIIVLFMYYIQKDTSAPATKKES